MIAQSWIYGMAASALLGVANAAGAPAWVEQSDHYAQELMRVIGTYNPETASFYGVEAFDQDIYDLRRDRFADEQRDLANVVAAYRQQIPVERDPRVRQDLEILTEAAEVQAADLASDREHFLPFENPAELVFGVVQQTLDPRVPRGRQARLVTRLRRYAGIESGYRPLTELAKERFLERLQADGSLLWPYRGAVERMLNDSETLIRGTDELVSASRLRGSKPAVQRLDAQLREYSRWVRSDVLPRARADFRLPAQAYAQRLRHFGIHEDPHDLIRDALTAFADVQEHMQGIAQQIAAERGMADSDYRNVVRQLKKEVIEPARLLQLYEQRLQAIERLIVEHDIVTLPGRKAAIRLATDAENAQTPAPHMMPPRMVGNTGEYGEFVLSVGMSPSDSGKPRAFDDFSHQAAAWSLTAHEARPGHELQFAQMIETGVSTARAVFAFNSANVEGWGLYAEAEMQPYEPLDGQLFALQMRAHRIARAFLDPMVNLGELSLDDARAFLTREVGLSEALATQEVERYSFRMPGQAGSYFYGYQRLLEIRTRAEIALGPQFSRRAFNDFVLAQGLVTPELLRRAIDDTFIPAALARPGPGR